MATPARMAHTVGEGASDLELDLPHTPGPLWIVIAHLPRRPHQHLFCKVSRNPAGSGKRADAEALGIEGSFLLAARSVDDSACGPVESRLGIAGQAKLSLGPMLDRLPLDLVHRFRQQCFRHGNGRISPEMKALVPTISAAGRWQNHVAAVTPPIEAGSDAAPAITVGVAQPTFRPHEIQVHAPAGRVDR